MLVSAEKITKGYGMKNLLTDVSLYISEGDKIGLIGLNGTGKTTLLKIIAGEEFSDSGNVLINPHVRIGYLPQNPILDENNTALEQVVLGDKNKSMDRRSSNFESAVEVADYEAKTLLNRFNITDYDFPVKYLSGGQKKRVAIAQMLARQWEMIILDEPTNHLDSDMILWLEKFLIQYSGTILMVTHDRFFLERVVNKIIEVENGNLYSYEANYSKYLELKAQRQEMEVSSERKRQSLLKKELEWIQRGARARSTKSQYRIDRFEQLKDQPGIINQDKLELSSVSTRLGKKTVEIDSISKSYDGQTVINNFSHMINRDARIGIVGKNGSGKTTLLDMICGKLSPDSGNIDWGTTVKIAYYAQENRELEENASSILVIDYIKEFAEYIKTVDGMLSASQMLEKFLFSPELQQTPLNRLSGGEKRRLYLLRTLVEAPNILLMDEPTNDLDIQTLTVLEDYLEEFNGAVIVVSHDRYFLDKVANRIFEVGENGEVSQYLGGHSDYYEAKLIEKAEKTEKTEKTEKIEKAVKNEKAEKSEKDRNGAEARLKPKKIKFTFKERQEYEGIDGEISSLEEKLESVEGQIKTESSNYLKLQELLEEKDELGRKLEEKMERWVYLNDLAEKIENQNEQKNKD